MIHAAKGCTRDELEDALDFAEDASGTRYTVDLKTIPRGGIVGSVEIVDCVSASASPWFGGEFGFVLRDPQPLPFTPFKGSLGFFNVPSEALVALQPNVRVKPAPTVGRQARDTENVRRTCIPGLVARRWGSA